MTELARLKRERDAWELAHRNDVQQVLDDAKRRLKEDLDSGNAEHDCKRNAYNRGDRRLGDTLWFLKDYWVPAKTRIEERHAEDLHLDAGVADALLPSDDGMELEAVQHVFADAAQNEARDERINELDARVDGHDKDIKRLRTLEDDVKQLHGTDGAHICTISRKRRKQQLDLTRELHGQPPPASVRIRANCSLEDWAGRNARDFPLDVQGFINFAKGQVIECEEYAWEHPETRGSCRGCLMAMASSNNIEVLGVSGCAGLIPKEAFDREP